MVTALRDMLLAGLLVAAGCGADGLETEQMKNALADLKTTPRLFIEDGSCDFGVDTNEPASVRTLLTRDGIKVLVAHLDDTTPTATLFETAGEKTAVPLGYLCLDLLLQISAEDSPVVGYPDAADDAPWPRIDEKYFFPPDVLRADDGVKQMWAVRAEWERLIESGRARFKPLL